MILKIFIFWRLGLFLLSYLGALAFPLIANSALGAIGPAKDFSYWYSWAQWDGGHYFDIAQKGYVEVEEHAFFPLFPLVVRAASFMLFGNTLLAGLLLTNISFLLFLLFFYKLVKKKFKEKTAFTALITFLLFPTTFFTVSFYSEGLFLLFSVLTFYFITSKKFAKAAIFASLASATRFVGIFLIIPIIFTYLDTIKWNFKKINRYALYIPLSITGFIAYSIYLQQKLKDPFYFFTAQHAWERGEISNPVSTIGPYLLGILNKKPIFDYLDISATMLFLVALVLGRKMLPLSWWLLSIFLVLVPTFTPTLASMPRYVLSAFPVFVIFAKYLEGKTTLKILIWSFSLSLQVILLVRFINGNWVA